MDIPRFIEIIVFRKLCQAGKIRRKLILAGEQRLIDFFDRKILFIARLDNFLPGYFFPRRQIKRCPFFPMGRVSIPAKIDLSRFDDG